MTQPCRHPDHDHGDGRAVVRIVPVRDVDADTTLQRRSLFQVGLSVAGAVAVLAACGPDAPAAGPSTPTTPTTPPVAPPPSVVPPAPVTTTTRTRRTTTTTPPPDSGGGSGGYGSSGGGGTLREPCLPTKIPKGYTCTCNCVAE